MPKIVIVVSLTRVSDTKGHISVGLVL